MRPVIVTVAPTGGSLTSAQHPFVPIHPDEIAADVARCVAAGASVAALHVRDWNGEATCDPELYRHLNRVVRSQADVVINNSSGGGVSGPMQAPLGGGMQEISWLQRLASPDATADLMTFDAITAWTKPPLPEVLMNTSRTRSVELGRRIAGLGIKPEWEVFNPSNVMVDIPELIELLDQRPPHPVNICLGLHATFTNACPWTPRLLELMVDSLPAGSVFTLSVSGSEPWPALAHAILLGGHIRVGLEDQPWRVDGSPTSNLELVERAVRLVEALGGRPASPDEAREMLGLESPQSRNQRAEAHDD